MTTGCGFNIDCSACYNQSRCSDSTCLGFVPKVTWMGEHTPFMCVDNAGCTTDCPYVQACYEAKEWFFEKKAIFD